MAKTKSPNSNRRSERSRIAVMEATKHLIVTVGYDKMSIEGIAAAAGVGKQTIYRWWPSKAAVVLDMWAPEIHPKIEFPETGDLAADLESQLRAVIELGGDPVFESSFRALIAESQHDAELSEQLLARILRPRIEACKERLRRAQAAGQLGHGVDLDLAVDLLYGGFYRRYVFRSAPLSTGYAHAAVAAALAALDA
jgi:AcrR family transcriptional regulator